MEYWGTNHLFYPALTLTLKKKREICQEETEGMKQYAKFYQTAGGKGGYFNTQGKSLPTWKLEMGSTYKAEFQIKFFPVLGQISDL